MPIIRTRQNEPFARLPNAVIEDGGISYKAKGILAYLLSKPDGWRVSQSDIASHSPDGAYAIRKGIDELIEAGYMTRERERDEKGHLAGWVYKVYDCPYRNYPCVDNPMSDNP